MKKKKTATKDKNGPDKDSVPLQPKTKAKKRKKKTKMALTQMLSHSSQKMSQLFIFPSRPNLRQQFGNNLRTTYILLEAWDNGTYRESCLCDLIRGKSENTCIQ